MQTARLRLFNKYLHRRKKSILFNDESDKNDNINKLIQYSHTNNLDGNGNVTI